VQDRLAETGPAFKQPSLFEAGDHCARGLIGLPREQRKRVGRGIGLGRDGVQDAPLRQCHPRPGERGLTGHLLAQLRSPQQHRDIDTAGHALIIYHLVYITRYKRLEQEPGGALVALAKQDRINIADLINLHGHLLDAGDLDRAGELFTPDVVYDVTDFGFGTVHGTAALREYLLALGEASPVGHHVTNIVITQIDERSARVRSKGLGVRADGTARSLVYDDIVTRQPDGWKISHRTITLRRSALG
jgi:ketosteroid isomerase-like protein